jgi:hypothetical protein
MTWPRKRSMYFRFARYAAIRARSDEKLGGQPTRRRPLQRLMICRNASSVIGFFSFLRDRRIFFTDLCAFSGYLCRFLNDF